jgi:hypothetical protein
MKDIGVAAFEIPYENSNLNHVFIINEKIKGENRMSLVCLSWR